MTVNELISLLREEDGGLNQRVVLWDETQEREIAGICLSDGANGVAVTIYVGEPVTP